MNASLPVVSRSPGFPENYSCDVLRPIPKQSGMKPCVGGLRRCWTWLILLLLGARWVQGSPVSEPPSRGLSMEFNGVDQQVLIPHGPALNPFPFTASFWLRTTQTDFHAGILGKYVSGSGNGWTVFLSDGRIRAFHFRTWGSQLWGGDMPGNSLSGGFVADGQWHHVAFTVDQEAGRLYVDGGLKDTVAWVGFPGAATSEVPLSLGSAVALPDGTGAYFLRGRIDEVRLWSRALTPEEVRASMLQALDENPAGLVAAYDFNQMSGLTLTNRAPSGRQFDGTIRGTAPPRLVAFDDPGEGPGPMLSNGGFEASTLAPWHLSNSATPHPDQPAPWLNLAYSAQGVRSFRVPDRTVPQRLAQNLATEPGKEYRLSFAYGLRQAAQGALGVEIGGAPVDAVEVDGRDLVPLESAVGGSWRYATRRFTATSTTTELAFLVPPSLAGSLHLDDVQVVSGTDPVPEITVELLNPTASVEEGSSIQLVVRRTGLLQQRAHATLELRAGTAAVTGPEADLRFAEGAGDRLGLFFQIGQSEQVVTLMGLSDARSEPAETATVHLLATGNAAVRGGPTTVTVISSPVEIRVVHTFEVSEAQRSAPVTLVVQRGFGGMVRIQTTTDGTATPGEDFVAVDQEVEVTSARTTTIGIPIRADSLFEGRETIGVRVTAVSENTVVTPTQFLITLVDNPEVTVGPEPFLDYRSEVDPVARFTVVRTGALNSPHTFRVGYRVEGEVIPSDWDFWGAAAARPGVDFVPTEGFLEFGPGIARHTIEVPLLDDLDGDGPRGLVLTLTDPSGLVGIVQGGRPMVVIRDNEHAALRQQVALLPYAPFSADGYERPRLLARPDGKTLVIRGRRVLQFTASGMPDQTFGDGTGQVVASLSETQGEWLPTPRQLPDGRLVFLPDAWTENRSRIHRWTVSGAPDPRFGGGSGVVELPHIIREVVQLSDDGGLLLVTESSEGQRHLRRLLPGGEADPGFVITQVADQWEEFGSIAVAPDGHLWRVSNDRVLWRLRPNGEVDPGFVERPGVFGVFGFDSQGRAYCRLEPGFGNDFGDESQGGLVRFLADGTYDAGYRPLESGTGVWHAEIEADGTALVVLENNVIVDLSPSGDIRHIYPNERIVHPVVEAQRQAGGRLLLKMVACAPGWGCGHYWSHLETDGTLNRVPDDPAYSTLMRDATGEWSWTWRDWEAPDGLGVSSEDRLFRTLTPAVNPQVGLAQSGLFTTGSSVRLPLQRAGNTSAQATVRGRILSWFKGRWDEATATPFEVSMASGVADWQVELPLPEATTGLSVRTFLVRLETATGVELSPFNECRIWAMNDAAWPRSGELRMTGLPGPGTDDTALLLLQFPIGKPSWFESKPGLGSGPWSPYDIFSPITVGPVLLMPLSTEEASQGFFRLRQ